MIQLATDLRGTLQGIITDKAGDPVPGITVSASVDGGGQGQVIATSAADGSWAFTGLDVGAGRPYALRFRDASGTYLPLDYDADPSTPAADMVRVVAGQTTTADVVLRRSSTLLGTITNTTGAGLPGITVTARRGGSPQGEMTTTTTADGSYAFRGLDVGDGLPYSLSFRDPSGAYLPLDYDADPSTPHTADMVMVAADGTTTADAVLRHSCALSGTITDSMGLGLRDITVTARPNGSAQDQLTTTTGPDGSYAFRGLDPAAVALYALSFSDAAGNYLSLTYDADSSTPDTTDMVKLVGDQTTADAVMRRSCTLDGTVTDSRTGKPVAGVKVWAAPAPGQPADTHAELPSAVTDAAGDYSLTGIPDGAYVLACDGQPPVYRLQYWPAAATPDTATPITLTPSAPSATTHIILAHDDTRPTTAALNSVTMRKRATARLKFRVTDAYGAKAKLTLVVATAKGKVKARVNLGVRTINTADSVKWHPTSAFSLGKYTWWVKATDLAGNTQSKIVKKTITLTR